MMIWHANISQAKTAWRYAILLSVVLGTLLFMMTRQPFGQVLAYHDFADKRAFLGVPNFLDVATNIAYLAVGLFGVWSCFRSTAPGYRIGWLTLFIGVSLIGFGSAYYHLDPKNSTLVWDRLPMTIGFMGLFVALLAEYIDMRAGNFLILPALAVGIFSVMYWAWLDDLRLYYWVQGMPLLIVPLLVFLFRPKYTHQSMLLVALGFYVLAKIAEIYDREVFEISGHLLSGHSLKHLLSAVGILALASMLNRRCLLQRSTSSDRQQTGRFGVASG